MTPWDRSLSNETSASPPQIVARWSRQMAAGVVDHWVQLQVDETISGPEELLLPLERMLAHFLVDQMPDEGLHELVESLANMFDFYARRSTPAPLPSPPRRTRARVVGRYERPVFEVTED